MQEMQGDSTAGGASDASRLNYACRVKVLGCRGSGLWLGFRGLGLGVVFRLCHAYMHTYTQIQGTKDMVCVCVRVCVCVCARARVCVDTRSPYFFTA